MRIPRVLIRKNLRAGETIPLPRQTAHHLKRVLRLDADHPVVVFDGEGDEYRARLNADDGVTLEEPTGRDPESPLDICLAQGVSRGQRMDYTLQKAVELGVAAIQPLFCERSVVRLDGKRLAKRMDHWRGVIESACEQSGRTRVPVLHPAMVCTALTLDADREGLFLEPESKQGLGGLATDRPVTLAVGPEGGFSEAELAYLQANGFQGVRMGPRILRTETAGVAALAILQAVGGDLR